MFGGLDGDTENPINDLYILRVGDDNPHWIKADTHGKPPLPRF